MKKLSLNELKIKSFRTSIDSDSAQTIKGGTNIYICEPTDPDPCGSHSCPTRPNGCGGGSNHCSIGCTNNCGQSMDVSGPCMC